MAATHRGSRSGLLGVMALLVISSGCGRTSDPEAGLFDRILSAVGANSTGTPDLWVSSVVGPVSTLPSSNFEVALTVCNQGTGATASSVNVYLSTDTAIATTDVFAGSSSVGNLLPGRCATVNVPSSTSGITSGTRYIGAIVDPSSQVSELNESNNARSGTRMGIGNGPDFIVSAVSGPPSILPNGGFDTVLTVCNQGTASGAAGVNAYLSADAAVTTSDTFVGSGSTGTLAPGECISSTVSGPANVAAGAWYLGGFVDPSSGVAELVESNNTRAGPRVNVGDGPDFTITAVSGPPSAQSGTPFSGTVTVCNQGTAAGTPVVGLYVSTDGSITTSDTLAGSAPADSLSPGQCVAVTVPSSGVALTGSYFLGALVDASNAITELSETNNAKAGNRFGLGSGPDFTVSAVKGPTSVVSGGAFTATVTVCNQGTTSAAGSVAVALSNDSAITTSDPVVGSAPVASLSPGACAPVTVNATTTVVDGTYYLGAYADRSLSVAELIENNNTLTSGRVGVGAGPDLVISAVSAPISSVPGKTFATAVTVCNQGTASSDPANVDVRLSGDGVINVTDTLAGTASVDGLAPGQCQTVRVTSTASVPRGTYYVGGIIDRSNAVAESVEDNNATPGNTMILGNKPDLFVSSVNGPTVASMAGNNYVLVTVCNQGADANATDLTVYLSADPDITPEDAMGALGSVGALAYDQCQTLSLPTTLPGSEGTWYLGAIADSYDAIDELVENNNATAGNRIVAGYHPDLVVTAVDAPASVQPGGTLDASATVCNRGNDYAPGTSLELRLSLDATPSPDDLLVTSVPVESLSPQMCVTVPLTGSAPSSGTYHAIASVDPSNDHPELLEDNNVRVGNQVASGNGADLVITELIAPSAIQSGSSLSVSARVCNQGTASAPSSNLEVRLSSDPTVTSGDPLVGTASVPSLDAGACAIVNVTGPASQTDGTWYLAALADAPPSIPELIESNNTSTPRLLGIGSGPNLVVASVASPAGVKPGQSFTATASVCNRGTGPSPASELALKLSLLGYGAPFEANVGVAAVGSLPTGQCENVTVPATGPDAPPGAFVLVATADATSSVAELVESDNTLTGDRVSVGYGPDFAITEVNGPLVASQRWEQNVALVTVCNQGTQPAYMSGYVVLSSDRSITDNDNSAGYLNTDYLAPGQCQRMPVQLSISGTGTWYLGFYAFPSSYELRTDNNTALGNRIAAGYLPDLVVTAVNVPPSAPSGGSLDATATVCNRGSDYSPGTSLELRLSSDPKLSPDDLLVTTIPVEMLDRQMCTTVPLTGPIPGSGVWYAIASVDPLNGQNELLEDNNVRASAQLAVGSGPDLVVTGLTAPAAIQSGSSLDVSATVCNQGTGPAPSNNLEVRLSSDPTVTSDDELVGPASVPSLDAGACATVSLNGWTSQSNGAWYLAALVDSPQSVPELVESNNTSEARLLGIGYGANLVVASVSGPHSILPGQSFEATASVCNRGTTYSQPSTVDLKLSLTGYGTPAELEVGNAPVYSLAPGECMDVTIPANAPTSPSGAFLLAAVADANGTVTELIETDNTLTGARLDVGDGHDFVITSVNGPLVYSAIWERNVALVTVCNQGTRPDYASFSLVFSNDTSINNNDHTGGSSGTNYLAPGQCQTVPVQLSSPGTEGAWHLGAFIYPSSSELRSDNNTALGNRIAFGNRPDLIVTALTTPASVQPGGSFNVSATVCNRGNDWVSGTNLELHLSTDAKRSPDDVLVANVPVEGLDRQMCATIPVTAPTPGSGTWYAIASADPSNSQNELLEDNNVRVSAPLAVGYGADLVITEVTAPSTIQPGSSFVTAATVCNQGTNSAPATSLEVRLSSDPTVTPADHLVSSVQVPPLEAGVCTIVRVAGWAYLSDGAWYLATLVDNPPNVPELVETNNTSAPRVLGIGYAPNLVVTSVSAPPSVMPGGSFTTAATVCNEGANYSPPSQLALKLSLLDFGAPDELPVGNVSVGGLSAGQCENVTLTATAPISPPGAFLLVATADATGSISEVVETDNTLTGARVTVGDGHDFVITSVVGPLVYSEVWERNVAFVTVCNHGTRPDYASLNVVFSNDTSINNNDYPGGNASSGYLSPSQCQTVAVPFNVPSSEGTWYLGAFTYSSYYELRTDNNVALGNRVVAGERPDLVVTALTTPTSVQSGGPFTASATVCNRGTHWIAGSNIELRLSTDAKPSPDDFLITNVPVDSLNQEMCATLPLTGPTPGGGIWYAIASVDPSNSHNELLEDNNIRVSGPFAIGYGPDLVVTGLTAPSTLESGSSFTASATVCNQGTGPASSNNLEIRISEDPTVTSSDFLAGSAPVSPLEAGACTAVSVQGWSPQSNGLWYVAALADNPSNVPELIESNNTSKAVTLGVGYGSNLVVTSVSGPVSVLPGAAFTATASVCNRGTSSSPPFLLGLKLSILGYGAPAELDAGNASVNGLPAGQCENVTISATAPTTPPGAYLLVAAADSSNSVAELIESDNTLTGSRIDVGDGHDFVVTSVNGPIIASESWNQNFALVTVCNHGTRSDYPSFAVVLSNDTSISADEYNGGSGSGDSLAPGQCQTVPVPFNLPSSQGTWYLGTILYPDYGELRLDNNTTLGTKVVAGSRPDLAVTALTTPKSLPPGGPLNASATVCNRGNYWAPGTNLELRLSSDAKLSPDDLLITNVPVEELQVQICVDVPLNGPAPGSGTWHVIASVDPANGQPELLEDNNVRVSGPLGIGSAADLVVTGVTAPSAVQPGASFVTTATVCNHGTNAAPSTNLEVRLSSDANVTPGDALAGTGALPALAPGACANVDITSSSSLPDGAWHLAVIADGSNAVPELIETNNTSAPRMVGLGHGPNLVVTSITGPASVMPGGTLNATASVCNQGNGSSPPTKLALRLSILDYGAPAELHVENAQVGNLAAGQCENVSISGIAPLSPPGAFALVAVADPYGDVFEVLETDNALTGGRISVGEGADFVITSVSGPSVAPPNSPITTLVTICNQGTMSRSAQFSVRLSSDPSITHNDHEAGYASTDLTPGECKSIEVTGSTGTAGTRYLGTIIYPQAWSPELRHDNNVALGHTVLVANGSDLVVSEVSAPAVVVPGEVFLTTVTVCNEGNQLAASTTLDVLLSTDAEITLSDSHAGTIRVGDLGPGACATFDVESTTSVAGGTYYVGAISDPYNGVVEILENNNSGLGNAVTVN